MASLGTIQFDISEPVKAYVEAEIARAQAEFERLTQQRDEARNLARTLLNEVRDSIRARCWLYRYPWLKDNSGEQ
jgi:DNA-binding transcriptional regulator/RsmH inhibitor MraZ